MSLPVRKQHRLKNYDYSSPGCYHITICVKDHRPVLGRVIPPETPSSRASVELFRSGRIAKHYIENIGGLYFGVSLDKYVIMPNHVHLLISLRADAAPSIPEIVRSFKRMVNRDVGESIWQGSYYDVIIRNDSMYRCEWTYIDNNPDKWAEDELYIP